MSLTRRAKIQCNLYVRMRIYVFFDTRQGIQIKKILHRIIYTTGLAINKEMYD